MNRHIVSSFSPFLHCPRKSPAFTTASDITVSSLRITLVVPHSTQAHITSARKFAAPCRHSPLCNINHFRRSSPHRLFGGRTAAIISSAQFLVHSGILPEGILSFISHPEHLPHLLLGYHSAPVFFTSVSSLRSRFELQLQRIISEPFLQSDFSSLYRKIQSISERMMSEAGDIPVSGLYKAIKDKNVLISNGTSKNQVSSGRRIIFPLNAVKTHHHDFLHLIELTVISPGVKIITSCNLAYRIKWMILLWSGRLRGLPFRFLPVFSAPVKFHRLHPTGLPKE